MGKETEPQNTIMPALETIKSRYAGTSIDYGSHFQFPFNVPGVSTVGRFQINAEGSYFNFVCIETINSIASQPFESELYAGTHPLYDYYKQPLLQPSQKEFVLSGSVDMGNLDNSTFKVRVEYKGSLLSVSIKVGGDTPPVMHPLLNIDGYDLELPDNIIPVDLSNFILKFLEQFLFNLGKEEVANSIHSNRPLMAIDGSMIELPGNPVFK